VYTQSAFTANRLFAVNPHTIPDSVDKCHFTGTTAAPAPVGGEARARACPLNKIETFYNRRKLLKLLSPDVRFQG